MIRATRSKFRSVTLKERRNYAIVLKRFRGRVRTILIALSAIAAALALTIVAAPASQAATQEPCDIYAADGVAPPGHSAGDCGSAMFRARVVRLEGEADDGAHDGGDGLHD